MRASSCGGINKEGVLQWPCRCGELSQLLAGVVIDDRDCRADSRDAVHTEDKAAVMCLAGWKWQCLGAVVVWSVWLSLLPGAWGHSDIDPRQSLAKKWETYTLNVPTETAASTVKVYLYVPSEFEIEGIEHNRAWQITTVRDSRGFIREVGWSENSIPPQTFEEFKFLARNPGAPGTYRWKIEQHYAEGAPATWEAQTHIVPPEGLGSQRVEDAWRAAQVATTVSFVAIGIAITLILALIISLMQPQRGRRGVEPE